MKIKWKHSRHYAALCMILLDPHNNAKRCVLAHEPAPVHGWQGENKEADHSRLAGGRFNEQGNLHMSLVLGAAR